MYRGFHLCHSVAFQFTICVLRVLKYDSISYHALPWGPFIQRSIVIQTFILALIYDFLLIPYAIPFLT